MWWPDQVLLERAQTEPIPDEVLVCIESRMLELRRRDSGGAARLFLAIMLLVALGGLFFQWEFTVVAIVASLLFLLGWRQDEANRTDAIARYETILYANRLKT